MTEVTRTPAPAPTGPTPAAASAGTGSGTGGSGGFANTVIVTNPAAALAKLAVGEYVDTTVTQTNENGRTRLSLGTTQLVLHIKPVPTEGTTIRFQVATVSPQVSLKLLGEHIAVRQHALVVTPIEATPRTVLGQVLTAHFTARAPIGVTQANPHLMSADSPVKAYTASAVTTASPSASGPLPNNGTVAVRIQAFHATANNTAAPPDPVFRGTASNLLTGEVSASIRGRTTVSTSVGTFSFDRPTGLPEGVRVQLQLVSGTVRQAPTMAHHLSPIMTTTHLWDEMQTVLQETIADPAVAQLVAPKVPGPGPRLTTTLVFFMSALYGGRLQDWLGRESVEMLRTQRPGLLTRLTDAFTQLGRGTAEPVHGDWRLVYLPFLDGRELEPLRLFLRHHADDESTADGDRRNGLRFVLEAELSRLGLIQLDGLVRGRNFDLVVHSPRPLAADLQRELRTIFANAAVATNFAGTLAFQSTPIVLQTGIERPTPPMEGILA